ncbi:hypothetical protein AB8613_01380 [Vibrio sp. BS-M-Sm-2]|uniref:hypothetical protein n=1 Tax=Vibrio sp. BS-M-Sm-2 TaxID=3241167 RepID=UPI00355634AE
MAVVKFLSEMKHISPEGRYLFLAIICEQINKRNVLADMSVSHLRESFGVSHKVVSELLVYLQYHHLGEVKKTKHGKHEFIFDSIYLDSLKEGAFYLFMKHFLRLFHQKFKQF